MPRNARMPTEVLQPVLWIDRSHPCLISNLWPHRASFHAGLGNTRAMFHSHLHGLYPSQHSCVCGIVWMPFFDFELDPNRDCELAHPFLHVGDKRKDWWPASSERPIRSLDRYG